MLGGRQTSCFATSSFCLPSCISIHLVPVDVRWAAIINQRKFKDVSHDSPWMLGRIKGQIIHCLAIVLAAIDLEHVKS